MKHFSCASWPRVFQWGLLAGLSVVLIVAMEMAHIPAALMLGPMGAGILLALCNARLQVPRPPYLFAQAMVGCMIANMIPVSVLKDVAADWPVFIGGVFAVIVTGNTLGWLLGRQRVLPGTSAIWGSSPGAASAMSVLAEDYGADVRLVAFMLYLRVIFIALIATGVASVFSTHVPASSLDWLPPIHWAGLGGTALMMVAGVVLAKLTRIPSGSMLIPLVLGLCLHGILPMQLPAWLLAIGYAMIGWSIGLKFNREILLYVLKALPRIVVSILLLIGICGLFAVALTHLLGISPLTAYLATAPGGADTMAIIAASSQNVDVAFVMAMQTTRLILVMLTGPIVAQFLAKRLPDALPERTSQD